MTKFKRFKDIEDFGIVGNYGKFWNITGYNFLSRRQIMMPGGVYYVTKMVMGLCFTLGFFVIRLPHQIGLYKVPGGSGLLMEILEVRGRARVHSPRSCMRPIHSYC